MDNDAGQLSFELGRVAPDPVDEKELAWAVGTAQCLRRLAAELGAQVYAQRADHWDQRAEAVRARMR